jgi:chlorophyll/bacteriochlorophyll a synthase
MGVRSLPVQLGPDNAAQVACWIMAAPQVVVVAALMSYGLPWFATTCLVLLLIQIYMMQSFMRNPIKNALYYSGFGVPVFVSGMMVSAFALRAIV